MKKQITLKDTSDWLLGNGIISVLTENFDVPWKTEISGTDLDLDYYANRSSNKVVSNLVELLLDENNKLSSENLNKLASIIYSKYHKNWERVFYAFDLEYNPIQNYNGDENFEDTESIESSKNNSLSKSETVTNTGTVGVSGSTVNTGTQSTQGKTEYKGSESDSGTKQNTGTQKTIEDTTDDTTYGHNNYLETSTFGKTTTDTLTFNNRKSDKDISGNYKDTHTPNNFKTTTESYAKEYTQNRRNAFNGGLTITDDSETLSGVGNGSGGSGGTPGSGNSNKTTVTESGSYEDQRTYTNYKESVEEKGTESHNISNSGSDTLGITGSKTENKDRDSELTRTDNLTETNNNTHSFTNREDDITNTRTDNLTETNQSTTTNNLSQGSTGTESINETGSSIRTLSHESHREGNLGVTSTQQMLTEEIELRKAYASLFDTIVFPDIDKVMVNTIFKSTYLY